MEIVKYIALGFGTLLGLCLLVLGYYVIGNLICEPIVRKFDLSVEIDGRYGPLSQHSDEETVYLEYVNIVVGKVLLFIVIIVAVILILWTIGSGVSRMLGINV